jgi:RsiW-degrading membrane proteinase PrsW (M82 family)
MQPKWPVWRLAVIGAAAGMGFQLFSFVLNPLPAGVAGNALLGLFIGRMLGGALLGAVAGALVALIRNAISGQKA